jgi:hypothetical protein
LREDRLQELAKALSNKGNTSKEMMIRQLITQKKQLSSARNIENLRGKVFQGSTTMLTIQDDNGNWIALMDKLDIEEAIVLNNKAEFQQPFTLPFYRRLFAIFLNLKD